MARGVRLLPAIGMRPSAAMLSSPFDSRCAFASEFTTDGPLNEACR